MNRAMSDLLDTFAKMHGGFRSYYFSQATAFSVGDSSGADQGKMYRMVDRGGKPMGGVCATLCAYWIVFHAVQDADQPNPFTNSRSVWDYLFNEGGLKIGAAQNIVIEHHQSTQVDAATQRRYLDELLKRFNIVKRTKGIVGDVLTEQPVPMTFTSLLNCARNITQAGGYKSIEFKPNTDGTGPGHEVCAWCDSADVVFVDPNFGEFWLPGPAEFQAWFRLYMASAYPNNYSSIIVHNYVWKGIRPTRAWRRTARAGTRRRCGVVDRG
jgi:hypothetical protein